MDVNEQLEQIKKLLHTHLEKMEKDKSELATLYTKTFYTRKWYDEKGDEHPYKENEFDSLYKINVEYMKRQLIFVEKVQNMQLIGNNKISKQMESLLLECIERMNNEFQLDTQPEDMYLYDISWHTEYPQEYVAIFLLEKFANVQGNIVLIGGNGSGKSSLVKTLKGNDRENISVIPAQKTLYFSLNDTNMFATRAKDLEMVLLENNIDRSKSNDDYDYFQFQNRQFTKLIVAMKKQYTEYLISCEENDIMAEKDKTIFGKMRDVFAMIFPDIKLHFREEADEYLLCEKAGSFYPVNGLSEGEKAVIYYAANVMMAKENSFIVVDEPETYLNPSLTNILWDILLKQRCDCQFIFITHSIDFVLGRNFEKIAWIKKFEYPETWDFDFVDNSFELPKTLMTEVLGSKKPIAFCEGDDKSSRDYQVYRAILEDKYTVIPVGGHLEVIKNCDVINQSRWLSQESIGIIDGDNFSEEKIQKLRGKNVYVLPFNEIEMFLVSEEIMEHMMECIYPTEKEKRIETFKEKFWEIIKKEKKSVALTSTKQAVDEHIQKQKIEQYDSVEHIEENLKNIAGYNVQETYENKLNNIEQIIEEKDYRKLLIVCNLKKEITKGVANVQLDANYEEKVIHQIMVSQRLKETLRKVYFEFANNG